MEAHLTIAAIALFVLAFAVVSGRLQTTVVTPPMAFVLLGLLILTMRLSTLLPS